MFLWHLPNKIPLDKCSKQRIFCNINFSELSNPMHINSYLLQSRPKFSTFKISSIEPKIDLHSKLHSRSYFRSPHFSSESVIKKFESLLDNFVTNVKFSFEKDDPIAKNFDPDELNRFTRSIPDRSDKYMPDLGKLLDKEGFISEADIHKRVIEEKSHEISKGLIQKDSRGWNDDISPRKKTKFEQDRESKLNNAGVKSFSEDFSRAQHLLEKEGIDKEYMIRNNIKIPSQEEIEEYKRQLNPEISIPKFKTKEEVRAFEDKLFSLHQQAVDECKWITDYLDISKFQETDRIPDEQHPFLYNEKYFLGLTLPQAQWLSKRPRWIKAVKEKRTAIALRKRNQKDADKMVNKLFFNTLNLLANRIGSIPIHPKDKEVQKKALEARERLRIKLQQIYTLYPAQWVDILEKYLPKPDGAAINVNNREFWNPDNPWLVTAFAKSIFDNVQVIENFILGGSELESATTEFLERRNSEFVENQFDQGPLGEKIGVSIPTKVNNDDYDDDDDGSTEEENLGKRSCFFCGPERHGFALDPLNICFLLRFMNFNGGILSRFDSGLCKRHNRRIAKIIKYAVNLNLFTWRKSYYSINNPFLPATDFGDIEYGTATHYDYPPFSLKTLFQEDEKITKQDIADAISKDSVPDRVEDVPQAMEDDTLANEALLHREFREADIPKEHYNVYMDGGYLDAKYEERLRRPYMRSEDDYDFAIYEDETPKRKIPGEYDEMDEELGNPDGGFNQDPDRDFDRDPL